MSIFTDLVHAGKPAAGADGTAMTVPIHPSVAYAYDRAEDVEPSAIPPEARRALGIGDGLVRLSISIEDAKDLIEDVDRALSRARG